MANEEQQLAEIRQQIDAIDTEIQTLLNKRAQCALRVADVKLAARKDPNEPVVFYRPEREAQVLRAVIDRNEGPLAGERVAQIIREVMSACLALEETMKVAYLGPQGTFTQAAAIKQFGHSVETVSYGTIDKIFDAVERGQCRYGVVPIENSTEGAVNLTLDCLAQTSLQICGEVALPIELNFLVKQGSDGGNIQRICAHQQALAQARDWLDTHYSGIERVAVSSNGEAAAMAEEDEHTAAIAGDLALESYALMALHRNIEDKQGNTTRFIVVNKHTIPPSGDDRTYLMASARNEAGALLKLLQPFADNSISLTRLTSRPSRSERWTYVFFLEFEGHVEDPKVADIIDGLSQREFSIKHLGSFPTAAI